MLKRKGRRLSKKSVRLPTAYWLLLGRLWKTKWSNYGHSFRLPVLRYGTLRQKLTLSSKFQRRRRIILERGYISGILQSDIVTSRKQPFGKGIAFNLHGISLGLPISRS